MHASDETEHESAGGNTDISRGNRLIALRNHRPLAPGVDRCDKNDMEK